MQGLRHITCSLIYTAVFLMHSGQLFKVETGQSPLVSSAGDNVTLTCRFVPQNASPWMIQWNFKKKNVYTYDKGEEQLQYQHPQYKARTRFNVSRLPEGNADLVLTNISISDEGNYSCFVGNSEDRGEGEVELLVAVPYVKVTVTCLLPCQGLAGLDDNVTLLCQSLGGYPKPQVKWSINGTFVAESVENITEGHDQTFSIQSLLVTQAPLISQAECMLENQRAKEVLKAQYGSDAATSAVRENLVNVASSYDESSRRAHTAIIPSLILTGFLLGFFLMCNND